MTPRQQEVLTLLADGLTDKAIATQMFIDASTVRNYVWDLYKLHGLSGLSNDNANPRVRLARLVWEAV